MAFSSGVFTSTSGTVNGDGIFVGNKANTAAQLAKEKKMLYGNGISLDPTSAFYVAPVSGLTARVSAGWGIMEGYWFEESTDYDVTMTSSTSEQTLYIGVRLDVATGEYTGSHVAARTTFVAATDRVFAIIVIPANSVTLTSAMIADTRNNSTYCGTVNAQREALAALQAEYTEKLEVLESTGIPIHASTHATGQTDAITPASIGALATTATATDIGATPYDGWAPAVGTWTYASASTITVPSGAAAIYQKGDKIKFTQHGVVKYFYIITVADTLLTVTAGSDYAVEDTATYAITANYFSHEQNPLGFPQFFNFSPTWTNLTVGSGTNEGRFCISGRTVYIPNVKFVYGSGSSVGAAEVKLTFPVAAAASNAGFLSLARYVDTGTATFLGMLQFNGTLMTFSTTLGYVATTAPMTWTTGDQISISASYEMA